MASFKRVTDIIAEIAAASQEQTTGVDEVNKAVMQMDEVTQANAAQTEELSSTAQSFAAQALELQALVGRFKLSDEPPADVPHGLAPDGIRAKPAARIPRAIPPPPANNSRDVGDRSAAAPVVLETPTASRARPKSANVGPLTV